MILRESDLLTGWNSEEQVHANLKYKDRLFCMIFGSEEYKENTLLLYNALNHSHYTDASELTLNTIQNVLYIHMKNDVSFLVDSCLNLVEQQSTPNPNMPVRGFMYFGLLYEKYVNAQQDSIYGGKLIKIPTPRYFVLYNGEASEPPVKKLKLSDAFIKPDEEHQGEFEWTATVLNINAGNNDELVRGCKPLSDYMTLVNRIRENRKAGQPYEQAIDHAVVSCIEDHIMEDFLTDHRSEVLSVCLTEFDEEKFIHTVKAEGKIEGETNWQNRFKKLTEILSSANRINDILKSASEPEYAKNLMAQYEI